MFKKLWNSYKEVQYSEPKVKIVFLFCGLIGIGTMIPLFGPLLGAFIGYFLGAFLFQVFRKYSKRA